MKKLNLTALKNPQETMNQQNKISTTRIALTQHIKRDWHKAKLYKSASEGYPMNE